MGGEKFLIDRTKHFGDTGVSKNRGTPKSSILIGFSIINHPFWGTLIFGNIHTLLEYQIGFMPFDLDPEISIISCFSTWRIIPGLASAWNPKQPFINGCFNWMIPSLYIGNGCFTKHPFFNGCLVFQVVNNHGDCKSPKDRVVGPLPNGHSWLINGGDPNHLQVLG